MAFGTPYYIGSNTPGTAEAQTITVGTGTTAGDAIIVLTGCSNTSVTISSVTDSKSNTYTAAISAVVTEEFGQVWISPDSTALTTSDTITVNYSSTSGEKLAVAVGASGVAASSEVDSAKASAEGGTASPSVTSGTLAHASELAIGVIFSKDTSGTPSGFGSFTLTTSQQSGTSPYVTVCYLVTSSTAAVTFSGTITAANWAAFIIPLLSGGGTTTDLTLAGTVTAAAVTVRRAGRPVTALMQASGQSARMMGKLAEASASASASAAQQTGRLLAATVTAATALRAARTTLVALIAAVNVAATAGRAAGKTLAATGAMSATFTRQAGKPLPPRPPRPPRPPSVQERPSPAP